MSGEGMTAGDAYSAHDDYCGWHVDQRPSDCTCIPRASDHAADCEWHHEQYPHECGCGVYGTVAVTKASALGKSGAPAISDGDNYDNRSAGSDRAGNWMQTYSGRQFWPLDPRADEVFIEDVAHALAMACRYGGHCERFYSVAEHSVLVSQVVPPEMALLGLLHDASEAYVADVIRPIKPSLAGYKEIELRVWRAIADRYGLPYEMPAEIKLADNAVLLAESEQIMKPHPAPWCVPGEPAAVVVMGLHPGAAEFRFLTRFRELTLARSAA